jgi:transposase
MVDTKVDKTLRSRAAGGAYKRPNFTTEFKRQLVEQTLEPGASVALIARRNEVNANLLFKWSDRWSSNNVERSDERMDTETSL